MFERLNEENDRPAVCGLCGRAIPAGESRISLEHEMICRECADQMELWQVLELLEIPTTVELFEEMGKVRRT